MIRISGLPLSNGGLMRSSLLNHRSRWFASTQWRSQAFCTFESSIKMIYLCSMEVSNILHFWILRWSGLPLLNGGLKRSSLLNRQVPQFMFIVEDFWMSDAYPRVRQVHFRNDNANVMFMLVLKSHYVHMELWNIVNESLMRMSYRYQHKW